MSLGKGNGMSLETEYKKILDDSFGKHFSGWDTLSPLDPLKVLSEAMTGSLGEIERRQRNYISGLMDSLPSLCGFAPKGAELPVMLLKIQPVARLTETRAFPQGTSFRFQKEEGACQALSTRELKVIPLFDLKFHKENTSLQVEFRYQGIASELTLQFVPSSEGAATQLSYLQVEVLQDGKVSQSYSSTDLVFQEDTASFRRFGNLTLRRKEKGALLFDQATQIARVTFTFDRTTPEGEITANVAAFRLGQIEDAYLLGFLSGEPWEEVFLPEGMVEAPRECYLSFADEKTLSLTRQETSFLELKHSNYELFKGSFFYNGANHSLIIPAADELVGGYNGQVQLCAQGAMLRPAFESLTVEFQGRPGDAAAAVEKVSAYKSLSSYLGRESKRSYLARFYAAMSAIQTQPSAAINAHDVQQQLLSAEPELRSVETAFDNKENRLIVYLLASNPDDPQATRLPSDLLARVSLRLSRILPLTIRWQIQPYRMVPVTLSLQAKGKVGAGCANATEAQETLIRAVGDWSKPPPFGGMHSSTSYRLQDLAANFSLERLSGVAAKGGLLGDSIVREAGEILHVEVKAQVSLSQEVSHVA